MLLFDANAPVRAANRDAAWPLPCRERLEEARRDPSPAFPAWSVRCEFLRVTAHPRALGPPRRAPDAHRFVAGLPAPPGFGPLGATSRRAAALAQALPELPGLRGNVPRDAPAAALMREHGVSRPCPRDADFRRFSFPTGVDPLGERRWLPMVAIRGPGRRHACRSVLKATDLPGIRTEVRHGVSRPAHPDETAVWTRFVQRIRPLPACVRPRR